MAGGASPMVPLPAVMPCEPPILSRVSVKVVFVSIMQAILILEEEENDDYSYVTEKWKQSVWYSHLIWWRA